MKVRFIPVILESVRGKLMVVGGIDMFRALQQSNLPKERLFTVTVGPSSKPTEASYHLLEPENVIECVELLVGTVKPRELGIIV